jgi:hypothetical protein
MRPAGKIVLSATLLIAAIVALGCARSGRTEVVTVADLTTEDYSVEVIRQPDLGKKIVLQIPDNPYEDDAYCECVCMACMSPEAVSEIEALVAKLRKDANRRTDAAAQAVLDVSPKLVEHEEWREIIQSTMTLLNNPTVVLVPMPGGAIKKVSLEKIGELDLTTTQIASIKSSVGGKMESTLGAAMVLHGVPGDEADELADTIMKTYLRELLGPVD